LNEIINPEDDSALLELAAELEAALVLAEEEATAAGKETPCATMVTPKGRFSKNSIVSRRNKCLGAGIKLDLGRLRKIALNGALTAQKREDESVPVSMEAVEQEMGEVCPGDFIALAFKGDGAESVWIQKVVRMRYEETRTTKKDKCRRVRNEVLKKASLTDARSKGLTFLGSWLTPVKGKTNLFVHNSINTAMEPTANDFFHISAYLGHCDVAVHQSGEKEGKYFLSDPSQMERFIHDAEMLQSNQPGEKLIRRSVTKT